MSGSNHDSPHGQVWRDQTWRERLQAYVDGAVSEDERAEVEAALDRSRALRTEYDALLHERDALTALFDAGGAEVLRTLERRRAGAPAVAGASGSSAAGAGARQARSAGPERAPARRRIEDPHLRAAPPPSTSHAIDRRARVALDSRDRAGARADAPRSASRRMAISAVAAALAVGIGFGGGLMLADPEADPIELIRSVALGGGDRPGGAADDPAPQAQVAAAEAPPWKMSVAIYHRLFGPETFDAAPLSAAALDSRLTRIGEAVALDLIATATPPPGLSLRQAQLLRFGDRPLAQIAFSDAQGRPIALCVIKKAAAGAGGAPSFESQRMLEQNTVAWSVGEHAFFLIGDVDDAEMRRLAAAFAKLLQRA